MQELTTFNIDQSTAKILLLKAQTAQNIIEIGKELKAVKEQLAHGEWLPYLERLDLSRSTAAKFMQVANEFSNVPPVAHLGTKKLFELLSLPASDRETFIEQPHELASGETKTVDAMTTRELREAIAARKEAEQELDNVKRNIGILNENRAAQVAQLNAQVRKTLEEKAELRAKLAALPEPKTITQTVEVKPLDYDQLKEKAKELAAQNEAKERQIRLLAQENELLKVNVVFNPKDELIPHIITKLNLLIEEIQNVNNPHGLSRIMFEALRKVEEIYYV